MSALLPWNESARPIGLLFEDSRSRKERKHRGSGVVMESMHLYGSIEKNIQEIVGKARSLLLEYSDT